MTALSVELSPATPSPARAVPLRMPHTDWLYHHLDIEGSEAAMAAFAGHAAGAGTIPWHLDLDQVEEDAFHTLALAGALSLNGAQVLEGQLCEAVGRRHRVAVGRVGLSQACPFDLHSLCRCPRAFFASGPIIRMP